MHFPTLDKARKWIFGDAEQQKAAAGSLLELKARAGTAVFEVSSAQVNEAINAFKRLGKVNMSLTEAVDFAIKHSRPDAGVISVDEAIEKALETKRSKRPSYVRDLRKRWSRFREWLPAAKRKALNTRSQLDVRRYLKNLFGLLVSRVKCWHRSCPPSSFSERAFGVTLLLGAVLLIQSGPTLPMMILSAIIAVVEARVFLGRICSFLRNPSIPN